MKDKTYTELYVLVFKETGIILTPDSFKKYWKNYGGNGLYGWRPAKKIYYTLGTAKSGFRHIPDAIKPKIAISKFIRGEDMIDGEELHTTQAENKKIKEIAAQKSRAKWEMENAQEQLRVAKEKLEKLKGGK